MIKDDRFSQEPLARGVFVMLKVEAFMKRQDVVDRYESFRSQGFTRTQIDVMSHLVENKSNRQIGSVLYVTEAAIKYHMTNIFIKMNVKNRTEVVLKLKKIIEG